jgi:Major Facilitator Superfamily
MLASSGAPATLTVFGVVLGGVGVLAALGLSEPRAGEAPPPAETRAHGKDVAPAAMLKTPIFWLMFVMMTMMSTGGLMVTSNFANFARDFGVADILVMGLAALPFALTVDRLLNGFTRPFFGWVSDRIGRENTMGLAFGLEAAAILLLLVFRADAAAFVALSGLVAHRHVRRAPRHDELRLPLYRPGRRLDSRGPGRRSDEGCDRKLDAGVRRCGGDGCRNRAARALHAEADASGLSGRPGAGAGGRVGAGRVSLRRRPADSPRNGAPPDELRRGEERAPERILAAFLEFRNRENIFPVWAETLPVTAENFPVSRQTGNYGASY